MNKKVRTIAHSKWTLIVFGLLVIAAILAIVRGPLGETPAIATPTVATPTLTTPATTPSVAVSSATASVKVSREEPYCVSTGTGSSSGIYTVGVDVEIYYGVADNYGDLIMTDEKSWAGEIGYFKEFTPWFSTAVKSNTENAPIATPSLHVACLESGKEYRVAVGDIVYVAYTPMETPDFVRDDVYKEISLWLVTGAAPESWYHISNPEDLLNLWQITEFSCGPSRFILSDPHYMKLVPAIETAWSPLPYAINDDDLMYGGKIEYTPIGLQFMCGLGWVKPRDVRLQDGVNEIYLYKFTPGETWLWRQTIEINN